MPTLDATAGLWPSGDVFALRQDEGSDLMVRIEPQHDGAAEVVGRARQPGASPRYRGTEVRRETLTPKAEAARVLRRVGYPPEAIEDMLAQLPDPLDLDRLLVRHGPTIEALEARMGGSS
jgi:hypothetical protein